MQRIRERLLSLLKLDWILPLALAVISTALLVGPLVNAGFGPIDDHEYIEMLGPDLTLPLTKVPAAIAATEVGSPGHTTRYRPFYYSARVLEASLGGDNPHVYYGLRVLMFGVFTLALFWVGIRTLGVVLGPLLVALALDLPFWGDVWARLGPSEQYATVGFGLFVVAVVRILRDLWFKNDRRWDADVVIMALGLFIAAGSKENFVFMALPVAALTALGLRQKRVGRAPIALAALGVLCAGAIFLFVYEGVAEAHMDIHGQSAGSRLAALGHFWAQFIYIDSLSYSQKVLSAAIIAGVIAIPAFLWLLRAQPEGKRDPFLRLLRFVALINGVAIVWLSWEVLFYSSDWPTNIRYDFPGMMAPLLVFGSILFVIYSQLSGRAVKIGFVAVAALGLLSMRLAADQQPFTLRAAVQSDVERTQQFDQDLVQLARQASPHSDWPIYVESGEPADYESVLTLRAWFRWRGVTNPAYLRLNESSGGAPDAFRQGLWDRMAAISRNGGDGYLPLPANPTPRSSPHHCYSVSYSGPVSPDCVELVLRRW